MSDLQKIIDKYCRNKDYSLVGDTLILQNANFTLSKKKSILDMLSFNFKVQWEGYLDLDQRVLKLTNQDYLKIKRSLLSNYVTYKNMNIEENIVNFSIPNIFFKCCSIQDIKLLLQKTTSLVLEDINLCGDLFIANGGTVLLSVRGYSEEVTEFKEVSVSILDTQRVIVGGYANYYKDFRFKQLSIENTDNCSIHNVYVEDLVIKNLRSLNLASSCDKALIMNSNLIIEIRSKLRGEFTIVDSVVTLEFYDLWYRNDNLKIKVKNSRVVIQFNDLPLKRLSMGEDSSLRCYNLFGKTLIENLGDTIELDNCECTYNAV